MPSENWSQIEELFQEARKRDSAEREAWLNEQCGDDRDLRQAVDSLLVAENQAGGFLNTPAVDEVASGLLQDANAKQHDGESSVIGKTIGRYRILNVLGEGGMGVVYLAEQDKPRRTVALKVMKPGYTSANMLKRFEHETQMLGRLQHPGIAQIHDAGTSDDGNGAQPYFAMEYVQGKSLLDHANEEHFGNRQRVQLFIKIAQAVQHAHQQGVVHRDLKPSNILITQDGQPKILDFGIARSTDSDIQTTTMRTDVGQLLGTIPYMSPEQVAGDPTQLDARSDVYALGVVLYELLTDRLPHDLRGKSIPDAVRIISETDPTPLSTISRVFRGDLDTIISKALEKEKDRRYQSAAELALDCERYLDDQPIIARPPSTVYQFKKFAKRNKALVGGVAAVFVALILGIIATSWQATVAATQRDLAQDALEESKLVNEFLDDMLASASPIENPNAAEAKVLREILDAASKKVETQFSGRPAVEASLRATIAKTYRNLGLYEPAKEHYEKALAINRELFGDARPEIVNILFGLATISRFQGELDRSESLIRDALDYFELIPNERGHLFGMCHLRLGEVLLDKGQYEKAENYLIIALQTFRQDRDADNKSIVLALTALGSMYGEIGRYSDAEEMLRECVELSAKVNGNNHPNTAQIMSSLAVALKRQNKLDEAEPFYKESLESLSRALGHDHILTLAAAGNYASALEAMGRLDEAETMYRQVLADKRRVLGAVHPDIVNSLNNLASLLSKREHYEDSIGLFREAVDVAQQVFGDDHPVVAITMGGLGGTLQKLDDPTQYEEAETHMLHALEIFDSKLPPNHPFISRTLENLAKLYAIDSMNNPEKLAQIEARLPTLAEPLATN